VIADLVDLLNSALGERDDVIAQDRGAVREG